MDAQAKLKDFKKALDKELQKYLQDQIDAASKYSPHTKEVMENISDLTLRGGKRIRAALLYYSYLAHGGKKTAEAMKSAMGMEMSETYLLIHDDIMDDDDLRRGGKTIHTIYRDFFDSQYPDKANAHNFGTAMGINAGDAACALSNALIADTNFKEKYQVRALLELNRIFIREVYGQTLDIYSEVRSDVTRSDVILVQQLKTVPYTFDSPMKLGAILAGASEKQINALTDYTLPLGTAFQIQDDILGMFGSEEKLGKPVISDLREGKRTLLILDALENATPKQAAVIQNNLGNKKVTYAGLEAVRKIIIDTGALEKSKNLAIQLVQESIAAISKLKLKPAGKDFLVGIAEYMINREY